MKPGLHTALLLLAVCSGPAAAAQERVGALLLESRTDAERQALDRLLALMWESPTARAMLEDFNRRRETVRISFHTNPESVLAARAEFDPERVPLVGSWASVDLSGKALRVRIDDKLIPYDPRRIAPVVAHELVGHVPVISAARRSGWGRIVSRLELGELRAVAVEGVVQLELGGRADDPELSALALSTEAFAAGRRFAGSNYAISLSLSEARAPLAAYRLRLQAAAEALAGFHLQEERWRARGRIAEHFASVHKMDSDLIATARQEASERLDTLLPDSKRRLAACRDVLEEQVRAASEPRERSELALLRRAASSPFASALEEETGRLVSRLRGMLRERGPLRPLPTGAENGCPSGTAGPCWLPQDGWSDWALVKVLYADDIRRNPEHWPEAEKTDAAFR